MSDLIERQKAIDIERNATVDTNPSHFEAHQKFTQFMDDAEVSSFGRWQWSNGFNTALTAVGIDLKKLPSAQPVAKDTNVPINVNDCISRHDAINVIMDADVCVTWNGVISDDDAVDIAIRATKGSVIGSIAKLPSAQPEVLACGEGELIAQPKIIRCKECVYADENYHCDYMTTWNDGDCFCCYGKRRNDEQ